MRVKLARTVIKTLPPASRLLAAVVASVVVVTGIVLTMSISAAGTPIAFEAESGSLANGAVTTATTGASGGSAVKFAAASTPTPSPTPTDMVPLGVPGTWTLKFDDEFNGTSLDLTKWSNCWFSPTCGSMNNVTTNPANVAVSGGNLILTLASASSGALISTDPTGGATTGYQFTTGFTEARVYFPGNGTTIYNWPAWWANGNNWPSAGEHDIAEGLGDMTVNYHSPSGSHNQGTIPGIWSNAFHTYGLHRMAGRADVYYDGVLVKSYTTDDNGAPNYLILNVGAGNQAVYGTGSQLKVDYVRAWQ